MKLKSVFTLLLFIISTEKIISQHTATMFGCTKYGGTNNHGTLYSYNLSSYIYHKETDYDLDPCPNEAVDGNTPFDNNLALVNNKLYGVVQTNGCSSGPLSTGYIYEFNPINNTKSIIYDFGNTPTLIGKSANYVTSFNNKLYGYSFSGGIYGSGSVFEFDLTTNQIKELIPLDQTSIGNSIDGDLFFKDNKIYFTTTHGAIGTSTGNTQANYKGNLVEYDFITNSCRVLGSFLNTGGGRARGVMFYKEKFYGASANGGQFNKGYVFSYTPSSGLFQKEIDFGYDNSIGIYPYGKFIVYKNALYIVTNNGGANNHGAITKYLPSTNVLSCVKSFDINTVGGISFSNILLYNNKFYGTTMFTSVNGSPQTYDGSIFEFDPASNNITKLHQFINQTGTYPCVGSLQIIYNNNLPIISAPNQIAACNSLNTLTIPVSITDLDNDNFTISISSTNNSIVSNANIGYHQITPTQIEVYFTINPNSSGTLGVVVNANDGYGTSTFLVNLNLTPNNCSYSSSKLITTYNTCGTAPAAIKAITDYELILNNLNSSKIIGAKEEMTTNNSINVYPNPTINELIVNTDLPISNVVMTNSIGKKWNLEINNNKILLSEFCSGIYILEMIINNKIEKYKVIKE